MLDLWRSAPSPPARFGRAGCLTLTSVTTTPTSVRVSGRESQLFEHSFVVQLRGARGGVIAARGQTAIGAWTATLPAGVPRQLGTLEAFAGSAKDGSLDCLVQVPVSLGAEDAPVAPRLADDRDELPALGAAPLELGATRAHRAASTR